MPSVAPRCRRSSSALPFSAALARENPHASVCRVCSIDPMPGHDRGTLVQDQGSDDLAGLPDLPPATV